MVMPFTFGTATTASTGNLDTNFTFLEVQGVQVATCTGGTTAYALTVADVWTGGYGSFAGRALTVVPNATNTGATTVNVSGLGAANLYKNLGGTATALASGDFTANVPQVIVCDGTNFWLVGGGASASPVTGTSYSNLKVANNAGTPNTEIDVTAGAVVMLDSGGNAKRATSVTVTINGGTTGANGLDAGSLANTTWYYIYLINNGTTTAGLASTSATAPTLPSGYTYMTRVGAMVTDSSATFKRTLQLGNQAQYVVTATTNTANLPIIASGTAGSVTTPTWVSVSTATAVPPTAENIRGTIGTTNGTGAIILAPNNAYGAQGSTTNPPPVVQNTPGGNGTSNIPFNFNLESSNIFWATSTTSAVLIVLGWTDNL